MSNYLSAFAEDLENMIEMKTALGYKKSTFIDRAHKFDEFCLKNFPEESVDQRKNGKRIKRCACQGSICSWLGEISECHWQECIHAF